MPSNYTPTTPLEIVWSSPQFDHFAEYLKDNDSLEILRCVTYLQYLETLDDITPSHVNYLWINYIDPNIDYIDEHDRTKSCYSVNISNAQRRLVTAHNFHDFCGSFADRAVVRGAVIHSMHDRNINYSTKYHLPLGWMLPSPGEVRPPFNEQNLFKAYNKLLKLHGKKEYQKNTPFEKKYVHG
ncbi:hypothetical protein HZU75_06425 [Chitinibacter fontanus]|uniref:Uncharacterized protein n=1 Tax=Chitinibacter fontanus TaxID=1737446 RepID=A0A7D5V946_9NEIS|nr:hypothetical protein [Chitinibacter fontanus]QLI81195.1 hypothetical protein HZU75_06425 [Chitinibacter fontanus]